MVQVQIMQEDNPDLTAPPLPPPPPHQRRPRVREVSSRFMSPAVQRRPRTDPDSAAADENSETPFPMGCSVSQRKQPQRSLKLFKENNNGHEQVPPHPSKSCSGRIGSGNSTPCVSRPGTPTPSVYVSSRYRLSQQHHHHSNHHHHRFANGMASAAEKLMQASGLNQAKPNAACSSDDSGVNCSVQSLPELGDRDMLLQSNLSVGEIIGGSNSGDLKFRHPSPLSRSVNLPSSGTEKQPPSSVSKQHGNGNQLAKSGGLSLPPVPPQSLKPAVDVRRGKKGSGHQEDVHSLRLLYNRYLQWRFANAKGHTTMKAQQVESQVSHPFTFLLASKLQMLPW